MLDEFHSIPLRIAALKRKLAARVNKAEYKQNVEEIRTELARLEAVTLPAVASEGKSGDSTDRKDITL